MRKIEALMNVAIKNNTNWSKSNTSVTNDGGVSVVYLHGNKIAEVGDDFVRVLMEVGSLIPPNLVSTLSSTSSAMHSLMVSFRRIFNGTFVTTK